MTKWSASKILYLTSGIFAAAAIAVGAAWAVEHNKNGEIKPTPTTAPDPFVQNRSADSTMDGCLPSVGQEANAVSWTTHYNDTSRSCRFATTDTSVALAPLESGQTGIKVSKTGDAFSVVYEGKDLSTNTNGYVFTTDNPGASYTTFMIPFKGASIMVAYDLGGTSNFDAIGLGYENGSPGFYLKSNNVWSRTGSYQLPSLQGDGTDWSFFGIKYHVVDGDTYTMRAFLLTRDSPDDEYEYSIGGQTTPFPVATGVSIMFEGTASNTFPDTIQFGGTVVWPNISQTSELTILAAHNWVKEYGSYKSPTLYDVADAQTFYVGFDVANRSYANPKSIPAYPYDDNEFLINATLPDGMTFNKVTGAFEGTPQAPYDSNVDMIVYNTTSGKSSDPSNVAVKVLAAPLLDYGPSRTFNFQVGVQGSVPAPATESLDGPITIGTGTLPAGLVLNADGSISGEPTTEDTAGAELTMTADVPDGTTLAGRNDIKVVVAAADPNPVALTLAYPPTMSWTYGVEKTPIAPVITVDGETASIVPGGVFSVAPALPDGLTIDPTSGVILGLPTTPTAVESYRFDLTVDTAESQGQASAISQIDVDAIINPPASTELVLTQYDKVDFTFSFKPSDLDAADILASDINPPLPEGVYGDGKRVYGQILSDSIRDQEYVVRAAFPAKDSTQTDTYLLATGSFRMTVNSFDDHGGDDGISHSSEKVYLATTVSLASIAVILFFVGLGSDLRKISRRQSSQ